MTTPLKIRRRQPYIEEQTFCNTIDYRRDEQRDICKEFDEADLDVAEQHYIEHGPSKRKAAGKSKNEENRFQRCETATLFG